MVDKYMKKKMFKTINIMKMQIKAQWDITLYLLECFYQKRQSTNVGKDVEKREPLCTDDGKVNHADPVENSMNFPQKLKIELIYNAAITFLDFIWEKRKCQF